MPRLNKPMTVQELIDTLHTFDLQLPVAVTWEGVLVKINASDLYLSQERMEPKGEQVQTLIIDAEQY